MSAMFSVNQESVDRVVRRSSERSNAVLDAVDDFCEFVRTSNSDAKKYAEKHSKQGQTATSVDAYF